MRNRIVMAAALSLCMQVFASGGIIKEDFVKEDFVPSQPPAEVIYTADTLRFKVISESAVEVIEDISYKKLKTVIIPSKVRIEGRAYDVTSIGRYAFSGCSSLTGIEIPPSVTEIGREAFSYCSGLTNIKIPPSVTEIGVRAFSRCSGLTGIKLPPSVTEIGDGAFSGCSGLTGINVSPDNPNYSSVNGVLYNKSQTETICCPGGIKGKVKLPASVTKIGEGAFFYCSGLTNIKLPPSVTEIGDGAFSRCSGLTGINVSPDNPNYSSVNGVMYNKSQTETICCPGGIKGKVKLPPSVTKIGEGAFFYCSGLTNIKLPPSVTEIGRYAFWGCSGLTGINVSQDNPYFSSVNGVLYNKSQTETICCPGGIKGKIKLPASVTEIGPDAFSGCSSLTGIVIPSSVTSVGSSAFYGCKNLDITIDNSEGNVEIGDEAFSDCKSVRYLK